MKERDAEVNNCEQTFFPVEIDESLCNGCNRCVEICQCDVFGPNPEKGKPPYVLFPGECWQEGSCVDICPQGAMKWVRLANQRVRCKRKETGEDFFV